MVAFSRNTYRQADNPYVTSKGNKIGEMSKSFSGALATIKKAEEPFSIERVASLGIPGLFRHYIFCLKHAFGSTHPTFGLGNSTQTPSDIYKIFELNHVIEYKHTNSTSEQKLFLNKLFKELAGVPVNEPA